MPLRNSTLALLLIAACGDNILGHVHELPDGFPVIDAPQPDAVMIVAVDAPQDAPQDAQPDAPLQPDAGCDHHHHR